MTMAKQRENAKLKGVYYTPQLLADYIVYRLFDEGKYRFKSNIRVLEPSVGGGIFLKALLNGNYYKDKGLFKKDVPHLSVEAIEINDEAAAETNQLTRSYDASKGVVNVVNQDYLEYFLNNEKKYDLIIGNPPYVRRRSMSLEQRELCANVHEKAGLMDKNPKNLWTSFFAGAKESLTKDGVIAFILPADLLQVKYSQEIREILHDEFSRVEIFTLNWVYFDDIEQDVVILICSNQDKQNRGVKFYHINNLSELEEPKKTSDNDNSRRQSLNKWTNYVLDEQEFKFIDKIHKKIAPQAIRYYCDSGAGIVTAANDYYIVDRQTRDEYSLESIAKLTVKKSSSMFPAVRLTKADLDKKANEGAEVFFLDFPDRPKNELPDNYKKYLKNGEEKNIHQRYKMLLRDNWYSVPSVWSSEAFFTKRSNIFPRIILNKANAYVTDAFYRIRVKDGVKVNNLTFSFYNTFTFIYAELMGRYYGGGVLELTPNEFKDLPLPYIDGDTRSKLSNLDELVRGNSKLTQILNYTDELILKEQYGLSDKEVEKLREIYKKLLIRRMKKTELNI